MMLEDSGIFEEICCTMTGAETHDDVGGSFGGCSVVKMGCEARGE
jgi:hypothetical protein